ncbi:MAG: VWA domain-containing protein [Pirellulaceae bacterium]|nr:VWA domain-containing protein [Pirellulaceae bacterium]
MAHAGPANDLQRPPAKLLAEQRPITTERREPDVERPSRATRPWRWVAPPAWAVSAALHCAALLVLALLTISAVDPARDTHLVASVAIEDELLEMVEIQIEELELQQFVPIDAPELAPGAADFGDVRLESQLVATDIGVGPVQESTIGEIGLLFGKEGSGMSQAGPGEGVAYFFGVKTKGNRFVFVVDNSNSMSGGKFETAVAELQRSIGRLNEHQQFYVIFFSDTAYPLFYPQTAKGLVPATDENKRRLEYWLMTVERCLQTRGLEAMQLAFSLRPDAIYILGDGAFTDRTADQLLATPPGVTIHTLGFRMNPQAEQDFRQIAQRFGGKFTEVQVTPQMVTLSRQLNRPRNRTRHGVWGIRLPAGP